jgi:hypothetical protein
MLEAIAELCANFIVDVLLVGIFYWPGWLLLRVVTLGRYPPPRPQPHNETFVASVALALILVVIAFANL